MISGSHAPRMATFPSQVCLIFIFFLVLVPQSPVHTCELPPLPEVQRVPWPDDTAELLALPTPVVLTGDTLRGLRSQWTWNAVAAGLGEVEAQRQLPSKATANWKSVMSKYATSAYKAPVVNRYFVLWGPSDIWKEMSKDI